MILRPPRSTLFPTRRSSDLESGAHARDNSREDSSSDRFDRTARGRNRHRSYCLDRKSTRLNSSHQIISYAVFCLKKKKKKINNEKQIMYDNRQRSTTRQP